MTYFNDKHGAYCDINAHHQSKTIQIKTKGSFVYPSPAEARKLAAVLISEADEIDRAAALNLGLCGSCKEGELRARSIDWAICLRCREEDNAISKQSLSLKHAIIPIQKRVE